MKKAISLILLFTILLSCFVSCNNSGNVPDKPDVDDNPSGTNDNPPATIDVAEVNISQSSLTMVVGDRKAISATVVPSDATNKTLTWSSTNTAIADYVNGEIVALGIGNCVIKATSNNGKVASCMVSVKNKAVLAESVSFPGTTYYMGIGENKYYTAYLESYGEFFLPKARLGRDPNYTNSEEYKSRNAINNYWYGVYNDSIKRKPHIEISVNPKTGEVNMSDKPGTDE